MIAGILFGVGFAIGIMLMTAVVVAAYALAAKWRLEHDDTL
jgi:uncharacterized membrane protein (DUF485 family)